MNSKSQTPLLDTIKGPASLRKLKVGQLQQLTGELRADLIDSVAKTGGHLGAGLGVVELTVALHYIFNTPHDRLVWDVGHQSYPHKILTGRRDKMGTIRKEGGLSGFARRVESEYDTFGAGHSSTSISAALGMSVASHMAGVERKIIAVIGDGAMSAGMAYEAMNNAGTLDARLIVILNDNDMSIAPATGAMSAYLARLVSGKTYLSLRETARQLTRHLPKFFQDKARKTEEYARGFWTGGTMFEELGFYYVGPIDGHNLDHLLPVLQNVRNADKGPILVHAVTRKGKGYLPAEEAREKYHGVSKFDVSTGMQVKSAPKAPTYTKVFAQALIEEAECDEKIVGITAAMPSGTGLDMFGEVFPDRMFDVGIAEQHAVTFAAGLACEGYKPFATIYSTFLQRAFDQIVHDVSVQQLPVRFPIDRAGFVGADGPTHVGAFDVSFLANLPGFTVMAAADEAELKHMVATAVAHDEGPVSFRYPRGEAVGVELPERGKILEIGRGRIVREGSSVALLSFGARLQECLKAAEKLDALGVSTTVADARFAKPLDIKLIRELAKNHEIMITIEEACMGSFGSYVADCLLRNNLLENRLKFHTMYIPDEYIDHASPDAMYTKSGMDDDGMVKTVLSLRGALT